MKEYRDAFKNLKVPDDMAIRIQRELAEAPQKVLPLPMKRTRKRVWAAAAVCAACLTLIIGVWKTVETAHPPQMTSAPPAATGKPGESLTIPNPIQKVSSPEDFQNTSPLHPVCPRSLLQAIRSAPAVLSAVSLPRPCTPTGQRK